MGVGTGTVLLFDTQLEELGDCVFVHQSRRIGQRRQLDRGRVDWRAFVVRWFGNWLFGCLAMLVLQFDNPHVEPFDFFEGNQVDFTQQFYDLVLGCVHARIMTVAGAGVVALPGECECVLRRPVRRGGLSWRAGMPLQDCR